MRSGVRESDRHRRARRRQTQAERGARWLLLWSALMLGFLLWAGAEGALEERAPAMDDALKGWGNRECI